MRRTRWWSLLMLITWVLTSCAQLPWENPTATPAPEDLWPPVVVAYQPASGEEVTTDATITVRFDQPMERKRTENAFSIEPAVDGTFFWPDVRTLTFRPQALQESTTYHVRIDESARAFSGQTLLAPLDFTFSTREPLQLTQILPPDETTALRVDSPILIGFNRPVVPASCMGKTAGNHPACPVLPITLEPAVLTRGVWLNEALYSLTAYPGWNAGTSYRLILRGEIQAYDGSRVQVERESRFSVAQPQVVRVEPLDQKTANLPPETSLRIVFNNPMDAQSTAEAFSFTQADGTPVPGNLSWNEDNTIMTFTPARPLSLATRYAVRLSRRARAITTAPLAQEGLWIFETIPAPAVRVIYPPDGAKDVPHSSSVRFAVQGEWDENTLRAALIITPTAGTPRTRFQDGVLVVDWERPPRTTTCVAIPAGLEDAYGQVLTQGAQTCFTTADLPVLFEPTITSETLVIDADAVARLSFLLRNVTRMSFQLYRVDEQSFMTNAPVSGTPLRDWVERFTVTDPNALQVVTIDVMRGNPLRSGYYQLQWTDPNTTALRRVRLAVVDRHLSVHLGQEEALVWLSELHTTTPISNVEVRLLDRGVLLAAGTTNSEGLVPLRFEPRAEIYQPLFVVTGEPGRPGFGLVSTAWHRDVAPWDFGLTAQYDTFPIYTVWGFTDKQLYRPLENVNFAGLVRQRKDASYTLPTALRRVQATLTDAQRSTVYSATLTLSEQGTFEGQMPLPYSITPGLYTLRVTVPENGNGWETALTILSGVDDGPFAITWLLPQDELPLYAPVTVTVLAAYPTGVPVAAATGSWEVWRRAAPAAERIASGALNSDAQGIAVFTFPQPDTLPNVPEDWLIRVRLNDAEGNNSIAQRIVRVHPAPWYPEARLNAQIGRMRQPTAVQVRAVDANGKPVAGQTLTVTLIQRQWEAPVSIEAATSPAWQANEVVIQSTTINSGEDWSTVNLTPPTAGDYVVRVTGSTTIDLPLSVTGAQGGSWRQGAAQLVPVADKNLYRAGESAQILLPLGSTDPCRVLMTVMRNGIILRRFYDFSEPTPVISLPISQEFVPDVYVAFTAFYPGTNPVVKSGYLHLQVEPVLQTLRLTLDTPRTSYAPGEEVQLKLRVNDAKDQPLANARVLLAVTEVVPGLPLSNAFISSFYDHPLRLITGDTLHVLHERWAPLVNAANTAAWLKAQAWTRHAPISTAWPQGTFDQQTQTALLWEPALVTNDAGEVSVNVRLPQRVTDWMVRAFSISGEGYLGEAHLRLTAREPVRLIPQVPDTLSAGDDITLGVRVDNLSGASFSPELALMVEGATLLSPALTTITLTPQSSLFYTWTLHVPEASSEAVKLRYEVRSEGYATVAVTRTIAVRAARHIAYPVLTGALQDGTPLRASFYVPAQAQMGTTLHVEIYPSLGSWLEAQKDELSMATDQDSEAQALRLLALASVGGDMQAAVKTLYAYQHKDGGWGFWAGDGTSALYESALVTWALLEARRAGQAVDPTVLDKGLQYINQALTQSVQGDKACTPDHALAFLALATARYRWPEETPQTLYTCRQSLGITGQAYLALALGQVDAADTRIKPLLTNLLNSAREDGSWNEVDTRYHITPERATGVAAVALSTLQPNHKMWPITLQRLLDPTLPRREKAWSMLIVRRYLTAYPTAAQQDSVGWELKLNGTPLVTQTLSSTAQRVEIPLARLTPDATQFVELSRTLGEKPLYYVAYLALSLPSSETAQAVRLERAYCVPRASIGGSCEALSTLTPGTEVEVRLQLTVPTTRTHVLLEDVYPAGLLALHQETSKALNPFSHIAFTGSAVQLYAPVLPAGVYEVRYRLRAALPGHYVTPPATLRELYRRTQSMSRSHRIDVVVPTPLPLSEP